MTAPNVLTGLPAGQVPVPGARDQIRIPVSGMTCAACQARVQRALQKAPGVVDASVNLMMNSAAVTFDPALSSPDALVDVIRGTGYGATLASPDQTAFEEQEARDNAAEEEFHELRRKAIVSGIIGIIAMIVSMPLMTARDRGAHGVEGDPSMHWVMTTLTPTLRTVMPWEIGRAHV